MLRYFNSRKCRLSIVKCSVFKCEKFLSRNASSLKVCAYSRDEQQRTDASRPISCARALCASADKRARGAWNPHPRFLLTSLSSHRDVSSCARPLISPEITHTGLRKMKSWKIHENISRTRTRNYFNFFIPARLAFLQLKHFITVKSWKIVIFWGIFLENEMTNIGNSALLGIKHEMYIFVKFNFSLFEEHFARRVFLWRRLSRDNKTKPNIFDLHRTPSFYHKQPS